VLDSRLLPGSLRFRVGDSRILVREYLEDFVQPDHSKQLEDAVGRVYQDHLALLSRELGEVPDKLSKTGTIDVVDPREVDHDVRAFMMQNVLQRLRKKLGAFTSLIAPSMSKIVRLLRERFSMIKKRPPAERTSKPCVGREILSPAPLPVNQPTRYRADNPDGSGVCYHRHR